MVREMRLKSGRPAPSGQRGKASPWLLDLLKRKSPKLAAEALGDMNCGTLE
jgi:hypothetical protein